MRDLQILRSARERLPQGVLRTARKPGQQAVGSPTQLDFHTDLALKPGNSTVVNHRPRGRRSSVAAHHRRASQAAVVAQKQGVPERANDKRAARLSSMIYIS